MPLVKVDRLAMGSLFQIFLEGDSPETLERLGYEALDRAGWLEQQLSYFLSDSEISHINSRAAKESVPLAPNVMALLARCRNWCHETEGAFDITSAKLWQMLGVLLRQIERGDTDILATQETIAKIVPQIGWKFVELDEGKQTIRFHSSEVRLNLGAVGKGYVVQAVADHLRSEGVKSALLHCGNSSVVAIGHPADSAGWKIGIAESETIPYAALRDSALSISSNRESLITVDGKRFGHVFDPRTGTPLETQVQVAAIADDATDAEALSTAFLVNGIKWACEYLAKHPEFAALFLNEDNRSYSLFNGSHQGFVEGEG